MVPSCVGFVKPYILYRSSRPLHSLVHLFAPDQDDPAALEVLLSFHTLDFGVYPMSLTGAHFSQQLFKVDPSLGSLSRDYYRQFYAENFEDGHVRTKHNLFFVHDAGNKVLCCLRITSGTPISEGAERCLPVFFVKTSRTRDRRPAMLSV